MLPSLAVLAQNTFRRVTTVVGENIACPVGYLTNLSWNVIAGIIQLYFLYYRDGWAFLFEFAEVVVIRVAHWLVGAV